MTKDANKMDTLLVPTVISTTVNMHYAFTCLYRSHDDDYKINLGI